MVWANILYHMWGARKMFGLHRLFKHDLTNLNKRSQLIDDGRHRVMFRLDFFLEVLRYAYIINEVRIFRQLY